MSKRRFLGGVLVAVVFAGLLAARSVLSHAEDPGSASDGGPANPSWRAVMVAADEPGIPLIVTGTVYAEDGKTPVASALLYVYQTDATGRYTKSVLSRTPRLRGWVKTGADGRYEIHTIRPGSYPGEKIPAHIHGTLSAPGYPARWIEDFWFDDDPLLSAGESASVKGKGNFSPVLRTERGENGALRARRDFQLSPTAR